MPTTAILISCCRLSLGPEQVPAVFAETTCVTWQCVCTATNISTVLHAVFNTQKDHKHIHCAAYRFQHPQGPQGLQRPEHTTNGVDHPHKLAGMESLDAGYEAGVGPVIGSRQRGGDCAPDAESNVYEVHEEEPGICDCPILDGCIVQPSVPAQHEAAS